MTINAYCTDVQNVLSKAKEYESAIINGDDRAIAETRSSMLSAVRDSEPHGDLQAPLNMRQLKKAVHDFDDRYSPLARALVEFLMGSLILQSFAVEEPSIPSSAEEFSNVLRELQSAADDLMQQTNVDLSNTRDTYTQVVSIDTVINSVMQVRAAIIGKTSDLAEETAKELLLLPVSQFAWNSDLCLPDTSQLDPNISIAMRCIAHGMSLLFDLLPEPIRETIRLSIMSWWQDTSNQMPQTVTEMLLALSDLDRLLDDQTSASRSGSDLPSTILNQIQVVQSSYNLDIARILRIFSVTRQVKQISDLLPIPGLSLWILPVTAIALFIGFGAAVWTGQSHLGTNTRLTRDPNLVAILKNLVD